MWIFLKKKETQASTAFFAACVLLLNLPNFLRLDSHSTLLLDGTEFIERLLLCLLLTAVFLTLFTRPWRAWLALWLLCLWWQPLALGIRAINGMPINATLVGMVMATSPAELRNLLSVVPWMWFAFFALWNLACWGLLRAVHRCTNWRWGWQFRGKVLFFSAAMLALPYVVLPNSTAVAESRAMLATTPQPSRSDSANLWHRFNQADQRIGDGLHLPEAFPYELPWAVAQYWQGRRVIDAVRAHLHPPAPGYTLAGTPPQAEVVVLVIGESSTRNAWHWFNPQAPATTPFLEGRVAGGEHLFGFNRTLAQTTSTRQAVPSMLTVQPLVWPDGSPNPQATHSIVSVAAQAGYATAWFSNQAAVGKHDGIITSYAQEAAATAFLNPSGFADQGSLDEVLLPALRRHLADNARAFVVLHTLGSHFNYQHRYPSSFGPYPHSSSAREAYFNSVAYTDKVLDQIIDTLARDNRRAVLVYASDHGEAVPGGACKADSANRNTHEAYEVPTLVWLSGAYAQAYPAIAEQLRAHQSHPYTVAAVHQTLLDLMRADVQTPAPDRATLSFVRPSRHLDTNGHELASEWTDKFEKAMARNPCFMNLHLTPSKISDEK
ncbi:MAG: phosphoethanolamine transferase [Comamonas sp.]